MNYFESLLTLEPEEAQRWKRYIDDSFLALGSILLLTSIIFLLHLYPRIPDSILIYLPAIMALASTRGFYAALLASAIAFFAFDLLFVAPIYSLVVTKFADILSLIIFIITAIIISQLASALRLRAEQANNREHELRLLYDFARATNREENITCQLHIFARAIVEVFSTWGIRDCILLLPNLEGTLSPSTSTLGPIDQITISPEEQAMIVSVIRHGQATDFYAHTQQRSYSRLIPLQTEKHVVGVLRLLIEEDSQSETMPDSLGKKQAYTTPRAVLFSTFLEQAIAVIEQERLRRETLQLKVLQQIDALRAALLSSVSHDLRIPLTIIKTAASNLLQENAQWSEGEQSNFVSTIEHETDRLNNFVEKILDIARIEAGTLSLELTWYPLDELILDVLSLMHNQLTGRKISIYQPDDLPPVQLDSVYIHQVLTNLVENAVHYTPEETPIDIYIQRQEGQIQVSVADRGPGISPAEREHIFDKFYRVLLLHPQNGTSRQTSSDPVPSSESGAGYKNKPKIATDYALGFGLAICRGFIEAHGGAIWAEERAGGGAVFCFTLPLHEVEKIEL